MADIMRKHILERDAKDSICPLLNRCCEGSKCMMWSWSNVDPETEKRKADHRSTINEASPLKPFVPVKGYCSA